MPEERSSPARHTVLLAGAGDLGQRAARELSKQGHAVWGLRRRPPAHSALGIQWIGADLTCRETLGDLPAGITHVVYAPSPDERRPDAYRAVFLDGLKNLLFALDASTLQRFVFVSSTAVYGPSENDVDENTITVPRAFNGEILLQAEQQAQELLGEKTIVFRPAGLYGPGRTVLLERLRQGRASVPTGKQWANRMHIDDAARACVHLLNIVRPASCYLGVDDHPYPIDELYDALAAMLNVPPPARYSGPASPTGKRMLNTRLRASGFELNWPDAIEGYRALINPVRAVPGSPQPAISCPPGTPGKRHRP